MFVCVSLIHYIYTGESPKFGGDDDNSGTAEVAQDILLASDRFNLTHLKLRIESDIAAKLLNPTNAAEWLVFADGHSCPLLKEACMDVYGSNLSEVKESPGWPKLKESSDLLVELLDHFANKNHRRARHQQNEARYNNAPTNVVNVKVKFIRPLGYDNLQEWCQDLQNVYVGRRGVVFVDRQRFPKQDSPFCNPFKTYINKGCCYEP